MITTELNPCFADLCEKILSEAVLVRQVEKLLWPFTSGSTILHLAKPIWPGRPSYWSLKLYTTGSLSLWWDLFGQFCWSLWEDLVRRGTRTSGGKALGSCDIRFYNLTSGRADITWSTLILVTKTTYLLFFIWLKWSLPEIYHELA